jgi:hypothetical protein
MHTKPLIDFVISEGKCKYSFPNPDLSDYQFIDNVGGLFADFLGVDFLNILAQSLVIQLHSVKENFLHLD